MIDLGKKSDTRDLRGRLFVLAGVFLAGLLLLAINLYRLMVVRYDEFYALSEDNRFRDVRLHALRGQIKDSRGEVLVDSRPSYDAFITPAFCQKCATEVIPQLQTLLGWDEEQTAKVQAQVKATHGPQRYQPLSVMVDISRDEFDAVIAHQYALPGVDVEPVPHRDYRAGAALAHVLGYMNEITAEELVSLNAKSDEDRWPYALGTYIGRRGVEHRYEDVLRGTDGWLKEVVNARGEVVRDASGAIMKSDEVAPQPGRNLILSIDARLQAEAERSFPGVAGAVVAIESKTGFVVAMVSRPSFDPNEMTGRVSGARLAALNKDPLQPMVFRPGAEHYSPGSTFKVVSMLAALHSGAFTPQTTLHCAGGFNLGARTWRCHSVHGTVHARTALQWSCDTYFYTVGNTIGINPIAEMGRALGLGAPTGFGVAAEVPGIMPDEAYHNRVTPGGYQGGMALNTAIGQGDVNVTPLQLAVVYSAVANGGNVWEPQVVRRVESWQGETVQEFAPKLRRKVEITEEQRLIVVDALTAVVNEAGGTAFRSRIGDVTMAGKTGTAQVGHLGTVRLKKEQMSYWERDHAWFAAFAPAEDPELTVVVLNEHGGHGGSDAAPCAASIMKKYFELKKLDGVAFGKDWQPPLARAPVPPPAPAKPLDAGSPQLASASDAGVAPLAAQPSLRQEVR